MCCAFLLSSKSVFQAGVGSGVGGSDEDRDRGRDRDRDRGTDSEGVIVVDNQTKDYNRRD